ncbi:unnamed protein product [Symbiodinium microadriaticum]|nr:unnamed protein product [Symbiodinium microadriaticum]
MMILVSVALSQEYDDMYFSKKEVNPEYIARYSSQARGDYSSQDQSEYAGEESAEFAEYELINDGNQNFGVAREYYPENGSGDVIINNYYSGTNFNDPWVNRRWRNNFAFGYSPWGGWNWGWSVGYGSPYAWGGFDPWYSPWGWGGAGWYDPWNAGGWGYYDPFWGPSYAWGSPWGWNRWNRWGYGGGYYRGFHDGYYAGGGVLVINVPDPPIQAEVAPVAVEAVESLEEAEVVAAQDLPVEVVAEAVAEDQVVVEAQFGYYNDALMFSQTQYLDVGSTTFKNNFNFAQLGAVFNHTKGDIVQDKFKGGSFAISLNRINNFNNEYRYDSRNFQNSITDSFIQGAGNLFPDELGGFEGIAYDHFLLEEADYDNAPDFIFEDTNGQTYISPNIEDGADIEGYASLVGNFEGVLPRQSEVIRTFGSQYQFNLAWGGNYDDFLYFGGAVGIQSVSFTRRRTYLENEFQFDDGTADNLLNFIEISDRLNINGSGINVSFGGIIRPVDFVTIGINYTSPTYYALNEENFYVFETEWNPGFSYVAGPDTLEMGYIRTDSDLFRSNYNLKSPAKLNVGTAVFLSSYGFITADVEFIDHTTSQLKSNDFVVTEDNGVIQDIYRAVVNYRLGAEFRYDQLRFRGGYNYMGDPYKSSDFDRSRSSYSLGLGYRAEDYFVDVAFINSTRNSLYSPYELVEDTPVAETENTTTTIALTLGFVF